MDNEFLSISEADKRKNLERRAKALALNQMFEETRPKISEVSSPLKDSEN